MNPAMPRNYALELNGKLVGRLGAFTGGASVANVVVEQGKSGIPIKHLSTPGYTPISAGTRIGMGGSFYDWIKQSWNAEAPREDGTVVVFDGKNVETSRYEFRNA